MWDLAMELIDVASKIAQTLIAGFGAWLAYQAFLKEDSQEAESTSVDGELKIFETTHQTTLLKKTANGIECHLNDRREGKRQGHRWTLSPPMISEILQQGDVHVNPGIKLRNGYLSIGNHTNWLYSKRLYPEPAGLHHQVVVLLSSAVS